MTRAFSRVSIIFAVTLCIGVWLFFVATSTARESIADEPIMHTQGGVLSGVSADSVYVFDLDTQAEVFARSADAQRPIASVTKLLSSALFMEGTIATSTVIIRAEDVLPEGRSGRLQVAQEYQNGDMLFPALLESSNDASAVMERLTENSLVADMNQYAQAHYLTQTHFSDASGLSDKNVSTARELGVLASELYEEFPRIFDITRLKTYLNDINGWMNNNPFINQEGYKGGKHGYTHEANRTVVAFFDEQLQSGQERTFVYVLLGSDNLATDMEKLRTYVGQYVYYE